MLAAFDAPAMELNCTGRTTTNSAPQALLMMNSQFALSGAEKLADAALRRAAGRGGFASAEEPDDQCDGSHKSESPVGPSEIQKHFQ
ncbi:MAG: DUF1553 domain-containing protein [bacterium]